MGTRTFRRAAAGIAAALVALVALAAPAAAKDGDWRLGHDQPIDSPSPLKAYNTAAYAYFTFGYDLLLNFKTEDGTPDPDHSLATAWEISEDGKTVTFTLRDGVLWSDGQPFTSEDVRWTFQTVIDNQGNVVKDYLVNVEKVEAPDPLTVVLTMKAPDARVTGLYIPILPKHVWEKYPVKSIHKEDGPQPAVTTAPYVLDKWEENGTSILEYNPNWWGAATLGEPAVKRVLMVNYKNKDGQLRDIKLGDLDAVLSGQGSWVKDLDGNADVTAWPADTAGFTEIAFNSCPPGGAGTCSGPGEAAKIAVVQDPAIRQALRWAIDRQSLADVVYGGQAEPGNGVISRYFPTFFQDYSADPEVGWGFDLEKAKQILADGGWDCSSTPCTKGDVKAQFELLVRSINDEEQNAAKRIKAWAEQVGIVIDLAVVTEDAINEKIYAAGKTDETYAPTYDAFLWAWGGDIATPYFNFDVFRTGSSWQDSFYSNPEYDKLTEQALQTVGDEAASADLLHQAERLILTDNPYLFLVHDKQIYLTRNDTWHGYAPSKGAPFSTNWLQTTQLQPGPAPAPQPATQGTTAAASETAPADSGASATVAGTSAAAGGATTVTAAPAAAAGDDDGGGSSGLIIAGIVVVAAAILGGALIMRRGGGGGGRGGKGGPADWTEE